MPNVTVSVDDSLKEQMDNHPEINWSEVARQAIREKIRDLEVMEKLVEGSELTEEDVEELAAQIDRAATERAMDDLDDQADA
jgi:cytochrome c553